MDAAAPPVQGRIPAVGDVVDVLYQGKSRWDPYVVSELRLDLPEPSFGVEGDRFTLFRLKSYGTRWRWPAAVTAPLSAESSAALRAGIESAERGEVSPLVLPALEGERDAAAFDPNAEVVRKCLVEVDDVTSTGRAARVPCGTVLGDGVNCVVCCADPADNFRAGRCYTHCGSIDHYGAPMVASSMIGRYTWLVRNNGRAFVGEIREFTNVGRPGDMATAALVKCADGRTMWESGDASELAAQLAAFVADLMDEGHAEPPARAPYVPPTVREICGDARRPAGAATGFVCLRDHGHEGPCALAMGLLAGTGVYVAADAARADRGDETCSEADAFDVAEWDGITPDEVVAALRVVLQPNDLGRRVANDLRALILNANHEWGELEARAGEGAVLPDLVWRCRRLHSAILCAALSSVGGLR